MAPLIRIVLRYLAGLLVGAGIFTPELAQELAADPELIDILTQLVDWLIVATGVALGGLTEWAYRLAKKHGWAT
jgi:hypothetical protein